MGGVQPDVLPQANMVSPNPGPLPQPGYQVEDAPAPRFGPSMQPGHSLLDRLALAIGDAGPMPNTGRGGAGQSFVGGLAQGFSRARMAKMLDDSLTQQTLRDAQAKRNERAIAENEQRRAEIRSESKDITKRRRDLEAFYQQEMAKAKFAKPPKPDKTPERLRAEAMSRTLGEFDAKRAAGIPLYTPPQAYGSATPGDAVSIADAIINGTQPPELTGMYRYGAPVRAELSRRGFDFTAANADWKAVQRSIATGYGPQQTRLRQAAQTAYESLDVVDNLSNELTKLVPRGSVQGINKASMIAARNGAFGPRAQQVATMLDAQITDIVSELGNVYMGGNSPTDHALSLAQKNLSADWSPSQLRAATELARNNLRIRLNSLSSAGVLTPHYRSDGTASPDQGAVAPPAGGTPTLPPGYEMRDGIPVRVRK